MNPPRQFCDMPPKRQAQIKATLIAAAQRIALEMQVTPKGPLD